MPDTYLYASSTTNIILDILIDALFIMVLAELYLLNVFLIAEWPHLRVAVVNSLASEGFILKIKLIFNFS